MNTLKTQKKTTSHFLPVGALGFLLLLGAGCTTPRDGDQTSYQGVNPIQKSQYSKIDSSQKQRGYYAQSANQPVYSDTTQDPYYTTSHSQRQGVYTSKSQSSARFYVIQGDENRIKGNYTVNQDGFPSSIGQGNPCVIFEGNQYSMREVDRQSKTARDLHKYDVTLIFITHPTNRDSSLYQDDLVAVLYDRDGYRVATWNQSQGRNKLINMVRQLQN